MNQPKYLKTLLENDELRLGKKISAKFTGYTAPHYYRDHFSNLQPENKDIILKLWNSDKKKVLTEFIEMIRKDYEIDSKFYYCAVPTKKETKKIFIDPILSIVKENFKNSIDLTNYLNKDDEVSFGDAKYINMSVQELKNLIHVDSQIKELKDENFRNLLILDDVSSEGNLLTSMHEKLLEIFPFIKITQPYVILKAN